MEDSYRVISARSESLFKDKGSRFIGLAFYVETEDQVKEIIQQVKKEHHAARHHCYAWRLGTDEKRTRASNDGEPSSSAGKPILGQIIHADLTNILIIVVRYFGGVLLGVSGLIHAYRSAASLAIQNAGIITKKIEIKFRLKFGYHLLNDIMQIIKNEDLKLIDTKMEESCEIILTTSKSSAPGIKTIFEKIHGISITNAD